MARLGGLWVSERRCEALFNGPHHRNRRYDMAVLSAFGRTGTAVTSPGADTSRPPGNMPLFDLAR
jgi:hypothetical protein